MAKFYTTKQDIENYLLITIDSSFDAQITAWIESVEAYIDRLTGRTFVPGSAASAALLDGNGETALSIPDAKEITELKVGDTVIPSSDYWTYKTGEDITRIVLKSGYFSRGNQNVSVTAKWGSALPADIKFAATVLVAGIVNNSLSHEGEVSSVTIGRYSVSYKTKAEQTDLSRVDEILKLHRKWTY